MTISIIFATAEPGSPFTPTMAFRGGTVLGRLGEQLASFGICRQIIIARPGQAEVLRAACPAGAAEVLECGSIADDMRALARIARTAKGSLVVAHADLVAHREALAGLLADPKATTGALVTRRDYYRALRVLPRVRVDRGSVISASSGYHVVSRPNATFLGLLRVGTENHEALAAAADELAALSEKLAANRPGALAGPAAERRHAGASGHGDGEVSQRLPPELNTEVASVDGAQRAEPLKSTDAPALVLVGLMRSGVHVTPRYLRGLHCLRVTDAAAVRAADEELRAVNEDQLLLDAAVKGSDGFFTTHFVSPYSKYIARWAARRGLTPNSVTMFSMALGLVAAACFATGARTGLIAGALVLQAAFTFDCVDGQLARYSRQFSLLGGWLDSVFDRAKEYVVYAGLAVGVGVSGLGDGRWNIWILAVAAVILQSLRHLVDFSYGARRRQMVATKAQRPPDDPADGLAETQASNIVQAPPEDGVSGPTGRPSFVRRIKHVTAAIGRESDRVPALYWFKRMIVLPIGERFALISVTAAFYDARVTFWALLLWGGVAACYVLTGRFLRTLSS